MGKNKYLGGFKKMDFHIINNKKEEKSNYSDGKLREKNSEFENDGKKNLSNYKADAKEKLENNIPKQIGELKNSYGNVTFGVNKDKELITVTSQKYEKNSKTLNKNTKEFEASSAKASKYLKNAKIRTNLQKEETSALEYRQKNDKTPGNMMKNMEKLTEKGKNKITKSMTPFYSSKEHKKEINDLKAMRKSSKDKKTIDKKISSIEKNIHKNETEKIYMKNKMAEFVKKSRNIQLNSDMPIYFLNKKKKPKDKNDSDDETKNNEK